MRKGLKYFLIIMLVILILIQFFRPSKNIAAGTSANDISNRFKMQPDVQQIFHTACYDCHSNNTRYPWYWGIQPVAWWMNNHINDAKRAVNYSEFLSYSARKQYKKIEETNEMVEKNEMPLSSYTIIHRDAILSADQKQLIKEYTEGVQSQLKSMYPPDSLLKR